MEDDRDERDSAHASQRPEHASKPGNGRHLFGHEFDACIIGCGDGHAHAQTGRLRMPISGIALIIASRYMETVQAAQSTLVCKSVIRWGKATATAVLSIEYMRRPSPTEAKMTYRRISGASPQRSEASADAADDRYASSRFSCSRRSMFSRLAIFSYYGLIPRRAAAFFAQPGSFKRALPMATRSIFPSRTTRSA
jgi:hypothetical protein